MSCYIYSIVTDLNKNKIRPTMEPTKNYEIYLKNNKKAFSEADAITFLTELTGADKKYLTIHSVVLHNGKMYFIDNAFDEFAKEHPPKKTKKTKKKLTESARMRRLIGHY